ncbi:MAG: hypothetical protein KGQ28_01720 [Hyphomicrobiales bacterium]|nr:hypothetical protein [Hyphomicrobiales bacterium]
MGATASVLAAPKALAQAGAGAAAQQPPPDPLTPERRATLAQYGAFSQHRTYGEIWIPGQQTVPQGWHPYPPCHWVKTERLGWYFDDRTPWGAIVHHHGRWKNDPHTGWFWVPDADFSPGWVLWRTSPTYIGWAPMPPDLDMQDPAALAALEKADDWLFMEVAKFGTTCATPVTAGAMTPALLEGTTFVTRVEFVDGNAIVVLPVYVTGPVVVIDVTFDPWPVEVFTQVIIVWNWIWHHVLIVNVQNRCIPRKI